MKQWCVLYSKESLEMWRNYKWIWVPLVFLLLGIMQPLSTYYLPEIIESMGGLPEGAVIDIPLASSGQVISETFSQFGTIGILIIVLSTMGVVSSERQSGVATLIMVKPVSSLAYISAKWAGAVTLTLVSFFIGTIGAAYYTEVLFENLQWVDLLKSTLIYGLWLTFVTSLTVLFSTILKGMSPAAFVTLLTVIALTLITSLFDWLMGWSPATLPNHAAAIMMTGDMLGSFVLSAVLTGALIIALVIAATMFFRTKELAAR